MSNAAGVVADEPIGTPSQETLDGILNGAYEMGSNCVSAITDSINYINEKLEALEKKKQAWIKEIKAYFNDPKKRQSLISKYKKKLQEELEPIQKLIDKLMAKLNEWKAAIEEKLKEIWPKPLDKVVEKMGPPISILWKFFQSGISISLSLDCITQIVDCLMAAVEMLIQPYIQYQKLVIWWGTNGPKMLSFMNDQISAVTDAISSVTSIQSRLASLMTLEA